MGSYFAVGEEDHDRPWAQMPLAAARQAELSLSLMGFAMRWITAQLYLYMLVSSIYIYI